MDRKESGLDMDGRRGSVSWWHAVVSSGLLQVCLAGHAAALQNTVKGLVTDEEGNPLEGATCVFTQGAQNLKFRVKSGKDGRFLRAGIRSGQYRIVCELTRYAHEPIVTRIGGGATGSLELRMVKTESTYYEEGFQAFSDGRFEEAVSQMELALADDPDDARAEYILGLSLTDLGKYEEALEHLTRVASSESELATSPMLNLSFGQTYLLMGDEETAEKYIQKAGNPAEISSMVANAGTWAFNRGQLEKAERYFQRALQANPQNVDALYGLGVCHIKAKRTDEALEVLKTLLSTSPEHEKAKQAEDLVKKLEAQR